MDNQSLQEILETFLLRSNFAQKINIVETYPQISPYIESKNNLYSLNEAGVKYLIDSGFKFDKMVFLKPKELEYFLSNGATYLIDLPEENSYRFSLKQLEIAVENGYKFTENSHVSNFPEDTIEYFCDKGNYDVMIPYFSYLDYYELLIKYYREKGYNTIFECAEALGIIDKICDIMLFSPAFKILSQNDIMYLKEKYSNEKPILSYISFVIEKNHKGLIELLKSKNDIYNFFDEKGPKKDLYNKALLNNVRLFYVLFYDDNSWKDIYDEKNDAVIITYADFVLTRLKKESYNILNYAIKENENIDKYFTKEGPNRKLYDLSLFDNRKLFNILFQDDNWKNIYNQETDAIILSYINFIINRGYDSLKSIITNQSDVEKYFDEFGPKKALYTKALTEHKELYNLFFQDDTWKDIYSDEEDKNVIFYINFTKKYRHLLGNIINSRQAIDKYFNGFGYTEELKLFLKENPTITESILTTLIHDEKALENMTTNFVNMFEYYLIDKYFSECESPKEQYDYLLRHLKTQLLFSFENDSIKKMIKTNVSDLDNFFNLFDLDAKIISKQDTSNNIQASLLDYKFRRKHQDIVEVFTDIRTIIEQLSKEELEEYLINSFKNKKTSKLDFWVKSIINELDYTEEEAEELKNIIRNYKYYHDTDPLHELCETYLEKCQSKYVKYNQDSILSDFGVKKVYDEADKIKAYSNYLLLNLSYNDFISIRDKYYEAFDDKSIKGYSNLKTLSNYQYKLIIEAIKNNQEPASTIKQEYTILKKFINKFSKFYIENDLISQEEFKKLNFKGTQSAIELEDIDFLKIIRELDLEIFLRYAKENPKVLKNLKKVINNYGLGRLPESIGTTFQDEFAVILPNGINNIGAFITKYQQFLKNKQRNQKNQGQNIVLEDIHLSFSEVIELISLANSETYELRRLLGKNEYYDFATNKRPHSSDFDRNKRETKLEKIVDYLYTLDTVTVPSHDMIIENEKNRKKINFIIGNRTNPANICHGERTGSCMRIGSIGEGLFLKCLTDKNWFHIRIEDPKTHEYISRISGFRNGNTVYLNQLREVPSNCSYTNDDLQEFISIYAKSLIDETKNSEYPIENVFINTKLAMKNYDGKEYILESKIQKDYNIEDVIDLKLCNRSDIWTDVRNSAYLLATTPEGTKTTEGYVPLKNGPDNALIYPAVRDKTYGLEYAEDSIPKHQFIVIDKEELLEKINRVHAMKEKLLGSDYRYDITDEIVEQEQIIDGYASSDWFVYIDQNNNIHTDYISEVKKNGKTINYTQSKDAENEMNYYIDVIKNRYNLTQQISHAV